MAVQVAVEQIVECAGCHSANVEWKSNEQGVRLCLCHTCGCSFWDIPHV